MAKKTPRYYQVNGFKWTLDAWKDDHIPILALPGGGGKTLLVAMLMQHLLREEEGGKVLYVAHRIELIKQVRDKLTVDGGIPGEDIGILLGGERRTLERPVQVASIQTLAKMTDLPDFVGIFIDEGHRAPADTYQALVRRFPLAKVAGLTATPTRFNGAPLHSVYTKLIEVEKMSALIKKGYLTSPRCFSDAKELLPKLEKVRKSAGDFHPGDLAKNMSLGTLTGGVLSNYQRWAKGRQYVGFAPSLEYSRTRVKQFNKAGFPSAHIDGETPEDERAKVVEDFRSGKLIGIWNYDILAEGFDLPACRVCIMARPTLSYVKFQQQAARIMRPYNGEDAILLDHALNIGRFYFPDVDRKFTLDGGLEKDPNAQMATKVCPQCYRILPVVAEECPECGYSFKKEERRKKEEKETELRELKKAAVEEERKRIEVIAAKNKYPKSFIEKYMKAWCDARGY